MFHCVKVLCRESLYYSADMVSTLLSLICYFRNPYGILKSAVKTFFQFLTVEKRSLSCF